MGKSACAINKVSAARYRFCPAYISLFSPQKRGDELVILLPQTTSQRISRTMWRHHQRSFRSKTPGQVSAHSARPCVWPPATAVRSVPRPPTCSAGAASWRRLSSPRCAAWSAPISRSWRAAASKPRKILPVAGERPADLSTETNPLHAASAPHYHGAQ